MATYGYKVIFEEHNKKFRLAGIADSRAMGLKVAGTVSSKGNGYNAVMIDYNCTSPLNDEVYIVYTKLNTENEDSTRKLHQMVVEGDYPSENDVFVYKLEKSATDRVDKINGGLSEEDLKKMTAVIATINMNKYVV